MEFTPSQSGVWEFRTSDNGGSDPYLWLYDWNGSLIVEDDDGVGDSNALISLYLESNRTYTIVAGFFYDDDPGSYTLTVSEEAWPPIDRISLEPGHVQVDDNTSFFFIPPHSGVWEFRTSDTGYNVSDPWIEILDIYDKYIDSDDDSGGGLNAAVSVHLDAGVTYIVAVKFYEGGSQRCTLTVSPGGLLIADETRAIAQHWLDGHPINDLSILESWYESVEVGGELYHAYYLDSINMYWFSILVNTNTGEMLSRMRSDGEEPIEEIEPLDDYYNRYF